MRHTFGDSKIVRSADRERATTRVAREHVAPGRVRPGTLAPGARGVGERASQVARTAGPRGSIREPTPAATRPRVVARSHRRPFNRFLEGIASRGSPRGRRRYSRRVRPSRPPGMRALDACSRGCWPVAPTWTSRCGAASATGSPRSGRSRNSSTPSGPARRPQHGPSRTAWLGRSGLADAAPGGPSMRESRRSPACHPTRACRRASRRAETVRRITQWFLPLGRS